MTHNNKYHNFHVDYPPKEIAPFSFPAHIKVIPPRTTTSPNKTSGRSLKCLAKVTTIAKKSFMFIQSKKL